MISYEVPSLKVEIGQHPVIYNQKDFQQFLSSYDTMFNFSDELPYEHSRVNIHWHPINEFGYWGYAPFYFFTILMDKAVEKNHKIYVHCHMGAHRSPMMTYLYLRSLGHSPDEAYVLFTDEYIILGKKENWLEETFLNDVEYGRIPADVVEFMKDVRKNKDFSMMTILKNRKTMDLPHKTIQKNGEKKPITQKQIDMLKKGIFTVEN